MRVVAAVSLTALLACGSARAAGTGEAEQLTRENQLIRSRAALLAAADPDSLLAATASFLGSKQQNAPERLALMARATAAAPNRADLAWWHLQLCIVVSSCDVKPIEAHLQELDPKNAAGWSGSLTRSAAVRDAAGVRAALDAMAAAERFDVYWNQLTASMANGFIKKGGVEPKAAFVTALGTSAAQALPFKPMAESCKGEALRRHDVLATCRRLSEVLRRGDTYATQVFGESLARLAWAEGSKEYADAARERHVVEYRTGQDNHLLEKANLDNAFAERRLAQLSLHRTEQEVVLADLAAAGINPDPPPSHGLFHSRSGPH